MWLPRGIALPRCDNSCTYVPRGMTILRSAISLFSAKYHVGMQNSRFLRNYILLVQHDHQTFSVIQNRWSQLYMFVHTIVLLHVLTNL
jgi:hypothetical protein